MKDIQKPIWATGRMPSDWATQLGTEYALDEISFGVVEVNESPLSGEWADSPTPRTVFENVTGTDPEYDEDPDIPEFVSEIADAWEAGYFGVYSSRFPA